MKIEKESIAKKLAPHLFQIAQTYMDKFYTFECQYDSGISLRKIFGATGEHCDGVFSNLPTPTSKVGERVSSLIIALNSDYEEGEFYFPLQKLIRLLLVIYNLIIFLIDYLHNIRSTNSTL